MLVQDIIDASYIDFRQVLSNNAPDNALFVAWVDRIQKDALHTGIYNYLICATQPVSVVANTSSYTIPTTTGKIRRINLVYDRTFDRIILPYESLTYPTSTSNETSPRQPLQIPDEMLAAETMAQYPKYYKLEGTATLVLFPAAQKSVFNGTYEVHYEFQAPDLTATTDALLIPSDGKDMVVAGVNQYVAQFLHLDTEAGFWSQQYAAMKQGTANN
jgi:hypothetical protein